MHFSLLTGKRRILLHSEECLHSHAFLQLIVLLPDDLCKHDLPQTAFQTDPCHCNCCFSFIFPFRALAAFRRVSESISEILCAMLPTTQSFISHMANPHKLSLLMHYILKIPCWFFSAEFNAHMEINFKLYWKA